MANLDFIKKSLPWLGTIAGILVPAAAPFISVATKIVGSNLNKPIAPTADALASALNDALGDPAHHAQLLAAEQAFQQAMQQMAFQHATDMEEIAAKDRDSARQMQIAVKSKTPTMLAWAAVITLLGCIYLLAFRTIPVSGKDALLMLLGAVTMTYKDVYAYFFGSSSGSDRKTELLANGNGIH